MTNKITCPHCNKSFEPTEAYKHELEQKLLREAQVKHSKELENAKREATLEASKQIGKELNEEKERNKKLSGQLEELLEETRKLRRKDEERDIEMKKKLFEEEEKIRNKAKKEAQDESNLKIAEKDKKLSDALKANEDLRRKLEQGSQQLQGEVLELGFEELLKDKFKDDKVEPVEKGVKGADVRQIVISPRGVVCGTILWETKRTRAWSDSWIGKLKKDLRAEKANIPVIVTTTLPKEADNEIFLKEGVWIASFSFAVPLAQLLRERLLSVGYQKAVSAHRGEKADHLYEYITSHEFRQQVEAMIETYIEMKGQITKERAAYERIWQNREKQVDRLLSSTANIVGAIQGEVGQTVFQVKGLSLRELEEGGK